jgi:hypothetical protein
MLGTIVFLWRRKGYDGMCRPGWRDAASVNDVVNDEPFWWQFWTVPETRGRLIRVGVGSTA